MPSFRDDFIINRPIHYQCKISLSGTNKHNSNYNKLSDNSATRLAVTILNTLCDDMVGPEKSSQLRYDVAVLILLSIKGWDPQELLKDLYDGDKTTKRLIDEWRLIKPTPPPPRPPPPDDGIVRTLKGGVLKDDKGVVYVPEKVEEVYDDD